MKFGGYGARATKTKLDSLPMMVRWIWTRTAACNSRVLLFVFAVVVLIYVSYSVVEDSESFQKEYIEHPVSYSSGNPKYLINTSKCRIPDVDPYNKDVYQYLFKERYIPCTKLGLLTYIEKNDSVVRLRVNTTLLSSYSYFHISCCYYKILRISDTNIASSACEHFENDTVITHPFIKVACSTFLVKSTPTLTPPSFPLKRQRQQTREKNRFSVLLVGIDTISKLNLVRSLPKTYAYVEKNFISLGGYNKIGDNTFPNLMAILTGQNEDQLNTQNVARKYGKITVGLFGMRLNHPPTDYYCTPYMWRLRGWNVPIFGLFWMNSFSHDDFNMASAMDEKVLGFLGDTSFRESHDNTILIFLAITVLAAIEQHWCTCTGHHYINPNETFVRSVATFVIEQINGVVKSFTEGLQCADYTLNKVVSAGISEHYRNEKNETVYYLLVIIRSEPGAMFEATVEAYVNTVKDNFKLLGDVSRVDSYGENSFCVGDTTLRKYCYCDGYVKKHLRLLGKLLGNVD
ncbi:hypothetical protein NQ317_011953 [Molorchus minor]|uniref:Uncharacterized protein n=1 Tax=Molorchus minor TaxID=1323400 RepID=A0ABQ9J6S2_9CUCU|nr:hypothetical protein NQ317_011953 [Molorchus minor]